MTVSPAMEAYRPAASGTGAEGALWATFAAATDERAQLTAWLGLTLERLPGARAAVLFEADAGTGAFRPVAVAPDPRRDFTALGAAAEKALARGRAAVERSAEGTAVHVAVPVPVEGGIGAVVAAELGPVAEAEVQAALRSLHWACGHVAARLWERAAAEKARRVERSAIALDVLALTEEHAKPEPAAMAVVNELTRHLDADRAAIGLVRHRGGNPRVRLVALSHQAWFRRRSGVADTLEAAMDEAFDQNGPVTVPPQALTERAIAVAHAEHARKAGMAAVLSVPLPDRGTVAGVLTLERRADRPFAPEALLVAETVAGLVGPVLALKARNRRWVGGRIVDGIAHALGVLLGPQRLSWKLLAIVLLAAATALGTLDGPFRISADATLRGTVQRAAVAPFQGFIDTAPVRAGDLVREGDVILTLVDDDLKLEALRWSSEVDRLRSRQRDALARYDRAEVALLDAQIRQAEAQRELARIRLARTEVRAPLTGLVVSGDLTQKLGSPVQQGEVLFEIAPLAAFRVDVAVDERDLRWLAVGQRGRLALTGMPEEGLDIVITRITPVAEAVEGRNTFRVEADLEGASPALRPGMEGVAKLDAGEARLIWVLTRRLVDWARHFAWTWWP
jgi:multidrug resistance efflux pump